MHDANFALIAEQLARTVPIRPGFEALTARVVVEKVIELNPELRSIPNKILELATETFVSELATALHAQHVVADAEWVS